MPLLFDMAGWGLMSDESYFDVKLHHEVQDWYRRNPGPVHIYPSKERFYSDEWIEELDKDTIDTDEVM
jgi:hypothetical protein